ncbi:hypothetical protein [Methylobacterium fujisawaense]|uniref:hypothetical protein n=1 Tax=Methylobacterium fujisawaense TaxID=107400 RepID=UPI00313BE3AD
MNVHVLPSARHLDAQANLDAFVARARACSGFGAIRFDDPMWAVTLTKAKRASSARARVNRLYFTEALAGGRGEQGRVALSQPFASFLKAVVRLREDDGSKHLDDHAGLIAAGRYLHAQMAEIDYDPCRLLPDLFHQAANAARKAQSPATAYAMGKKLAEIAGWVDRYGIGRVRLDFRNPIRRPSGTEGRLDAEARQRREEKLPSEASLNALATLANLVTEDIDILRMRVIELLVCGGWRINELLSVPVDCEVEEPAYRNGVPILDDRGEPVVRYGIRYWGEKGAPPAPKWIPTPLVDVAKRAVTDIRRITQPARDAAAFIAKHPWGVLAADLDRGDPAELFECRTITRLLGLQSVNGGLQWCRSWKVPLVQKGRAFCATRMSIAAAIRSEAPQMPVGAPLRLEDHLFLIAKNYLDPKRATIPGSVRFLTDQMIHVFIAGKEDVPSVFERFGMVEDDGTPIRMNTHQFRHWLNTLAQAGGMSQMEIARWSGRKDIRQNAAYDHVSGAELAARVRKLVEAGEIRGPLAGAHDRLPPQDQARFREVQIATAHVTELGMCLHDWSLLPCAKHGDCAGCGEHVVVKGCAAQRDAAERMLAETKALMEDAAGEAADGTYGAARWEAAHRRTVTGLEAIVAVHRDADIPDGTLVTTPRS